MYYAKSSTKPPFAKAILESGATTARAVLYPTHPRHLEQFREFLVEAGVAGAAEEDVVTALRELPAEKLGKASRAVFRRYEETVRWPFQPVIDGPNPLAESSKGPKTNSTESNSTMDAVIGDLPIAAWRAGQHLQIPVLTGFNTNEGAMFVPPKAQTNEDFRSFFKTLIPQFSDADLDALEKLYPDPATDRKSPYKEVPNGMGKQWARLDAAYSHYAYICPVLQTAHFLSTNSTSSPVYVYHFAAKARWGLANHGDEAHVVAHDMYMLSMPVEEGSSAPAGDGGLLGMLSAAMGGDKSSKFDPSKADKAMPGLRAVSDAMHGAWVNFVVSKDGNPNGDASSTAAQWPAFKSPFATAKRDTAAAGQLMVFGQGNNERVPWQRSSASKKTPGTPATVAALSEEDKRRCEFWWTRVELSEGTGMVAKPAVRSKL
jgi:carboxylesterase type B